MYLFIFQKNKNKKIEIYSVQAKTENEAIKLLAKTEVPDEIIDDEDSIDDKKIYLISTSKVS